MSSNGLGITSVIERLKAKGGNVKNSQKSHFRDEVCYDNVTKTPLLMVVEVKMLHRQTRLRA